MEKVLNDLLKQLAVLLEINGSQKEKLLTLFVATKTTTLFSGMTLFITTC